MVRPARGVPILLRELHATAEVTENATAEHAIIGLSEVGADAVPAEPIDIDQLHASTELQAELLLMEIAYIPSRQRLKADIAVALGLIRFMHAKLS